MAKWFGAILAKVRNPDQYKPLGNYLEKKSDQFPFLLTAKASSLKIRQGKNALDDEVTVYFERKTKISFVRVKVVDIPNLEDSGNIFCVAPVLEKLECISCT